jgi:quinoprotein glucose dehydrogenase
MLDWEILLEDRHLRSAWITLASMILPALSCQAAEPQQAADWPMFNRDLAGTRYSPLTQINTANVGTLTKAWTYLFNREGKTISGDSAFELYQEITPIVVNGLMYLPSGDRVVALEPETGKEIWTYELHGGLASFRGLAYWPGDRNNPPRIIFTTARKMMALNARTGKVDPGFGSEGEVPLTVPYDGAPTIYKNMLLIGTNFYGPGERHIGPQTRSGRRPDPRRAWLRRPHRQGTLDFSHLPASGRGRQRHLGE